MKHVLITVSRGIIEQVQFFNDAAIAIRSLSKYVKNMNVEHDGAALYDDKGFIANAKRFLDDNDEYIENETLIKEVSNEKDQSTYIIGNPQHRLGFMVASPDDPLGYDNPVEALSELGWMRKESGKHLKLYRVVQVDGPLVQKSRLEKFNVDCDIEDFDYDLINEYLN